MTHSKIDHILHMLHEIDRKIDVVHHELHQSARRERKMQDAMQDLKDQLNRNTNATSAITAYVKAILDKIAAAPTIEEVRKITAEFAANTDSLVAATVAGTPAA